MVSNLRHALYGISPNVCQLFQQSEGIDQEGHKVPHLLLSETPLWSAQFGLPCSIIVSLNRVVVTFCLVLDIQVKYMTPLHPWNILSVCKGKVNVSL